VTTELARRGRFPKIGTQHRPDIEEMRTWPAISVEDGAFGPGAQAETQRIRNAQATLEQIAPQRLAQSLDRVVRASAVHDAIEQ
jgi:hypothetical protein